MKHFGDYQKLKVFDGDNSGYSGLPHDSRHQDNKIMQPHLLIK